MLSLTKEIHQDEASVAPIRMRPLWPPSWSQPALQSLCVCAMAGVCVGGVVLLNYSGATLP